MTRSVRVKFTAIVLAAVVGVTASFSGRARAEETMRATELRHVPTPFTGRIGGIAQTPDGAIWFAHCFSHSVVRYARGRTTSFLVPGLGACPIDVAADASGNVWFTVDEGSAGFVGRIDRRGTIKTWKIPSAYPMPEGLIVAHDGSIWFAERNGVGHLEKDGPIVERLVSDEIYDNLHRPTVGVYSVAETDDGSIWFTESYRGRIDVLRKGQISRHDLRPDAYPRSIIAGKHHDVWFTDVDGVGHFDSTGAFRQISVQPQEPILGQAEGIALDSASTLWVAEYDWFATITPDGKLSQHSLTDDHCRPPGAKAVLVDRAGNVWFTEYDSIAWLPSKNAKALRIFTPPPKRMGFACRAMP